MNYFNPYFNYSFPSPRPSIFSFLKGARGINLSTILNGTQRTLGIINQAIPVIKQMQPMVRNAKTMFKVMNESRVLQQLLFTIVIKPLFYKGLVMSSI